MDAIATPAGTRAVLERYGLRTRKHLGQHYLIDPHVLQKIIRAANLDVCDRVLEIGPGIGAVTQALAEHAGQVLAVELDAALVPVLRDLFADQPQVTIRHGDILKLPLDAWFPSDDAKPAKVVANLPYYVTTPVLMRLLEDGPRFASMTVMVQREVAERMAAAPGSKNYGSLTLAVGYYADAYIAAYVPPHCFMPRPHVDSAVVHLTVRGEPLFTTDKSLLFQVIHAAFGQRRKTLVNGLQAYGTRMRTIWSPLDKSALSALLRQCGWPADVRGEKLSLADFARLADALAAGPHGGSQGTNPDGSAL